MNRKVNKKTRIIVRVKTQREELAQKEICDWTFAVNNRTEINETRGKGGDTMRRRRNDKKKKKKKKKENKRQTNEEDVIINDKRRQDESERLSEIELVNLYVERSLIQLVCNAW